MREGGGKKDTLKSSDGGKVQAIGTQPSEPLDLSSRIHIDDARTHTQAHIQAHFKKNPHLFARLPNATSCKIKQTTNCLCVVPLSFFFSSFLYLPLPLFSTPFVFFCDDNRVEQTKEAVFQNLKEMIRLTAHRHLHLL